MNSGERNPDRTEPAKKGIELHKKGIEQEILTIQRNSTNKLTNFFIKLQSPSESRIYVSKNRITKLKDWLNK